MGSGSFDSTQPNDAREKQISHNQPIEHSQSVQADLVGAIHGPISRSSNDSQVDGQQRNQSPLSDRMSREKAEPSDLDFSKDDPLAERDNHMSRPEQEQVDPNKIEDMIKKLERQMVIDAVPYIQQHGKDPEKEMVDSVKNNKVTFLGEIHTVGEPNPHREMVTKGLKEMPPGSILTTELPDVLKPIFDRFNASKPGSDFEIPDKLDGPYGKEALDLLRKVKALTPDIIDMWKAARDRGIKVEPIDSAASIMPRTDPQAAIETAKRDQHMKDDIMGLIKDNPNAHIIVEGGNLHAAHSAQHAGKPQTTAELLLADPEFQKQGGTLKSFYSQIASMTATNTNMLAATFGVHKPLAVDTAEGGSANKVGPIPIFEDPGLNSLMGGQLSDFDEIIVYPFEERELPKFPEK
jgi:hypothetical protein